MIPRIGQKLYHYAYGQMTVTAITSDGEYIETTIDMPEGINLDNRPFQSKLTWRMDAIGKYLFEKPDVKSIENGEYAKKDKTKWHAMYTNVGAEVDDSPSPVGSRKVDDAPSPVGGRGQGEDNGPSPVGSRN